MDWGAVKCQACCPFAAPFARPSLPDAPALKFWQMGGQPKVRWCAERLNQSEPALSYQRSAQESPPHTGRCASVGIRHI